MAGYPRTREERVNYDIAQDLRAIADGVLDGTDLAHTLRMRADAYWPEENDDDQGTVAVA